MQFSNKSPITSSIATECLILPIFEKGKPGALHNEIEQVSHNLIKKVTQSGDFKPGLASTLMLVAPEGLKAKRLLLLGMGEAKALTYKKLGKAITKAAQVAAKVAETVAFDCSELETKTVSGDSALSLIIQSIESALYSFNAQKSDKEPTYKLKKVQIAPPQSLSSTQANKRIKAGQAIAAGMNVARDLGNTSPNVCTPSYLATHAKKLGKSNPKLKVTVFTDKQIRELGMGAFTAVGQGSANPCRMICMEYKGGTAKQAPIAFVGKGVTFDTGGISIKPSAKMAEMKYDMCGAAAVIGLMHTIAKLQLPINVVGMVGAAENMPSGHACRPGDIVKTYSGKTVEILNTDAEGRLVLCDVLAWTNKKFKPKAIIDLATLTGACLVALGNFTTGVLGNDQSIMDSLLAASDRSGERSWQLPMFEEFSEQLKSPHADLPNIGGPYGGTITAAKFLENFVGDTPWVHLDIAASAWKSGDKRDATGRPIAMLTEYLISKS